MRRASATILPLVLTVTGFALAQGEPRTFQPSVTERLALGALLERQKALETDVQAVLNDARKRLGLPEGARVGYDPAKGLLVVTPEPAPVGTAAKSGP